ncbi:MAG: glycosyltransferase [Bdellovibrionales bacterium]|nr:glycosyltransferase [Bdellovibrionales bacterium]
MKSPRKWLQDAVLQERYRSARIALMLPCLNEAPTLAKVIRDFRHELPGLEIYVFDNGSSDESAQIARREGATVIPVSRRGKGFVVRKMFEVVEADYYILVDSDDTYDATGIWALLEPVLSGEADMMVGSRLSDYSGQAFRKFHRFGNWLIIRLINLIFRSQFTDICSGYRVMSRHFVKSIPFLRDGFEVETELSVYSLIYGFSVEEAPLPYRHRPANSFSKLRTFQDGYKVLLTIVWLARDLRPLLFFGLLGTLLFFGIALPSVYGMPDATFLHTTLAMAAISLVTTGLILNTLNNKFSETQVLYRRQNHRAPATGANLSTPKLRELREAAQS